MATEDSFHVRSTYARLDVVGVSGDGWEEGIERTRERSKLNRKSVARFGKEVDGIDELEKKMRGTLDRYGFFHSPLSTRSEHRIFAIPSPTLNAPKTLTPRKASTRPSSPTPPTMGEQPRDEAGPSGSGSTKGKRELARVAKWERMMVKKRMDQGGNVVAWDWAAGKGAKVSRRVYKGVPDRWRAAAWGTLIDQKQSSSSGKGKGRATDDELLELYQVRIDQPSTFDVQIDLDVPRTISGHVLFHTRYGLGQRALFHSLHSFSLYCEDCGYCQGMGSIAANLLCYFSAERTYALLVRLHDQYDLHSIFSPGFPGMLEAFYVQERILESMLPEVYGALKKEMISTSSYATKWYITLFSTTLPFHTQLRIWDAFFLEGQDLLIVVSVGILWAFRDNLHSKEASFETILSLLSSFFIPEDDDAFMAWVQATLALKGLRGKMDQWRGEWRGFVTEGVEMQKLM
ncbi:rab-GTPase-TBC domain-containing protein [Mrakia frigida]|uniref:TBC domain-containing protein n=1 Tax=Mrakia frigida TaxID=29902 RepID=UPI003FCC0D00